MTYYLACCAHPFIKAASYAIFGLAWPVLKANDLCERAKEKGR